MAEWIKVLYVGPGPVTAGHDTWYPGETHDAPAGMVENLRAEHGAELFVTQGGGETVSPPPAEPDPETVTEPDVIVPPKKARK